VADKKVKKRRAAKLSKSAIPTGTRCTLNNHRIVAVFKELQSLSVDQYPNASAVLTRVLLEFGVHAYLKRTGALKEIFKKHNAELVAKGKPADPHWYPKLNEMLTAAINDHELESSQRKALERALKDKEFLCTVADLNLFVHNAFVPPSPNQLRGFWEALQGVFDVFLEEPAVTK
jgi:hypothetical protein